MNGTEFDIERMLARSQLLLSILIIVGYFALLVLAGFGKMDGTYAKELTPFVGILVYYWFQRQRPHSAVDGTNGNDTTANPTQGAPKK
jgi:hypothetical protein